MEKKVLIKLIKKMLILMLIFSLFFLIPLSLEVGINEALKFVFIQCAMIGFVFAIGIISKIISSNQKRPKIIKNNKYFVREIPKDYSVAIASILIDNVFDETIDIPATILSLIGKSILKYEDKKIIVDSKLDMSNLDGHEKYLVECIVSKKRIIAEKFQELVIKDAISKGYIEKIVKKDYVGRSFAIVMSLVFINIIICSLVAIFDGSAIIVSISMIAMFILFLFLPLLAFEKEALDKKNPYKNTKLGKKEHQILLNLKEFLKEFSHFEKSKIQEVILWEDFIAYAYIFKLNKTIFEEFEDIKQISYLFNDVEL